MYDWFIDVRLTLKARLPKKMFKAQCKVFYQRCLSEQEEPVPKEKRIVFSNIWVRNWMHEYNVSLRKSNKSFQITQKGTKENIAEYLKIIWTVRKFFLDNYGDEPTIINGDQMALYRTESSSWKTLNLNGYEMYVRKNYNLSRERVTVFTQVSNDPTLNWKSEFFFKGKGTRTKINSADGMQYQWAPKNPYRLKHMLKTIENLSNCFHMFSAKNYAIYVLDDYSVHMAPEINATLLKRGYIFLGIGGVITRDIQVSETDLHSKLKDLYCKQEQELMAKQLRENPGKIPQPSLVEMMMMVYDAHKSLPKDYSQVFKSLLVTSALNGSEDYLVSKKYAAW